MDQSIERQYVPKPFDDKGELCEPNRDDEEDLYKDGDERNLFG